MGIEQMSVEEIQATIDGGYRAAGNIFRCMMDVLEARYGKEVAQDIAKDVVKAKAQAAGNLAASRFGKGGFDHLLACHRAGFPEIEVLELSPERYSIRDSHCAIVEGWRSSGLSEERIKELGDQFCWGDMYFAQCFNPDIKLEFQGRLAEGRPYCQWVFTLDE
jgi:hypothetical protein